MDLLSAYQSDLSRTPGPLSAQEETAAVPADLASSNLRYAYRVAFQYRGRGLPLPELVSQANLGLVEAAQRFDGDRGVKFISYAVWRIRRRILEAFEHSTRCGYPLDGQTISLDAPVDGEPDLTFSDVIPDAGPGPEEETAVSEMQAIIENALDELPEGERAAVRLYYGLDGQPHTLREAGHVLDLSHEQVRQLRDRALDRLCGVS